MPGVGTTLEKQNYQFIHEKPITGKNHYRLKQIDYNGQFTYSQVKVVEFGLTDQVSIFPTITSDVLNIHLVEEDAGTAQVYDLNGSLILEQSFEPSSMRQINLSQLPNGSYIVILKTGNQTYRERVFKL